MTIAEKRHYATMSNMELINCYATSGAKLVRLAETAEASRLALAIAERAHQAAMEAHQAAAAAADAEKRERDFIQSTLASRGYSEAKIETYRAKLQAHLLEFERSILEGEGDEAGPANEEESPVVSSRTEGTDVEEGREERVVSLVTHPLAEARADEPEEEKEGEGVLEDASSNVVAPNAGEATLDEERLEASDSEVDAGETGAGDEEGELIEVDEVALDIDIDDSPAPAAKHDEGRNSAPVADLRPESPQIATNERADYLAKSRELALSIGRREQPNKPGLAPLPAGVMVEHIDSGSVASEVHADDGRRIGARPNLEAPAEGDDDFSAPGLRRRAKRSDLVDDEVGSPSAADGGVDGFANTSPGFRV